MATKNQKLLLHTQKRRKEPNYNIKESHKTLKTAQEEERSENNKNNQETFSKMAINIYISTITLIWPIGSHQKTQND